MTRPLAAVAALLVASAPATAQAPMAFSVTAAAPRRVVRVQRIGAPFEFVLVK